MQKIIHFWQSHFKQLSLTLALIVPSLVVVAALWLPFGFSTAGLLEEWGLLGLYTTYGPIFFEHASGPLALHALRPLMVFPSSVAYALDANSFNYWHLLTILALILKGAAASFLIWILTGSRFWSALMGILVLLYPADTMQLVLRPLQINWAVALLLLASSLFIIAYQSKKNILSYALTLIASMLLLSAIFMYEATCTLILFPFLLLFVRDGFKKTLQQCQHRKGIIALWFMSFIAYILYFLIISPQIHSYQSKLLIGKNVIPTLIDSFPKLFSVGLMRGLIGGWFDAIGMTFREYSYVGYFYLIMITALISSFLLCMLKMDQRTHTDVAQKTSLAVTLRLGLVGIVLLLLGYAPYLLSTSHLYISQRTFLFATPGAAIAWVAFLLLIFHAKRGASILIAFTLLFVGFGAQLFQFHHYAQLSDTQRHILKNIIENFHGDLGKKTLVIFDESNQLDRTWMFLKPNLKAALTYFYQKPIGAIEICYLPTHEWRAPDGLNRMGTCIKNKKGWTFQSATLQPVRGPGYVSPPKMPDIHLADDKIVAITIKPDGSVLSTPEFANHKKQLQQGTDLTAIRYRNILTSVPGAFDFSKLWATNKEEYRWRFGNWWSLEIPIKGSGWREAEWTVNYLHHQASAWKTREKATLLFDLVPGQKPYVLRGKFSTILNPAIQDSIQIRINQTLLSLQWGKEGKFKAAIPPHVLVAGNNTIEFNSKIDPNYYGLSLALTRYSILPKQN